MNDELILHDVFGAIAYKGECVFIAKWWNKQNFLFMRTSSNDGFNGKIPVESACTS
jgi:hypothetical protein